MVGWKNIKAFGMSTLPWWELVVKPGIKKLGILRGRQMAKDSRSELNLLLVRQAYLNKKIKLGQADKLAELRTVHGLIQGWYQKQCEKIKNQSRASEFQDSEKVTIYHHEIQQKKIINSAILKLQTVDGLVDGHEQCASYLEHEVKARLLSDVGRDPDAQHGLLAKVEPRFTEPDNTNTRKCQENCR